MVGPAEKHLEWCELRELLRSSIEWHVLTLKATHAIEER